MFAKLKGLAGQGDDEGQGAQHRQEQSLSTVLHTHEHRTELLMLVAESTDSMRAQILDSFDPTKECLIPTTKLGKPGGPTRQDTEIAIKDEQAAEKPEGSTAAAQNVEGAQQKDDGAEDAKKALERRTKQLSEQKNVELMAAALEAFDSWRDKVIQRIGEAVNAHDDDASAQADSSPDFNEGSQPSSSLGLRNQERPGVDSLDIRKVFAVQKTPLESLGEAKRLLILHSLLLLLLSLETYTSYSRILMLHIATALSLPLNILAQDETSVAKGLLEAAKQDMNADEETKKKAEENSMARKWKVGLGAAAGAVLIGVTGGLAAPLLAAGVGSVMGGLGLGATATAGYLGALAGSAPLVGVLFGAYGGRMTGQVVDEYAKQVEDFGFIPIHGKKGHKAPRQLRVAIAISGWLNKKNEVVEPWNVLTCEGTEVFALRWELKALLNLGDAMYTYITSYAWSWAKSEIIKRTIFATLFSALTLPYGLAKAARVVDNPFSVARSRSEKAGMVLADALINKVQGERPVTLIGYSLGSRVIYSCLTELANRKAFGLVESVCLVGAPVPSDTITWRRMRSVVAGRVINVYSTKDYLLGLLYRTSSLQYGVSGLQSIRDVPGIENVDVSELVEGHTQYRFLIGSILQKVGLEDVDHDAVEAQIFQGRKEQEKEEAEREKNEAEVDPAQFKAEHEEKGSSEKPLAQ
ncbi:uncharacterized protein B0I36DRAFT_352172 [Microdochium trichocladiopsis]|uniref:DUF726-domain-containing protein n=1 Tax=Microdochium trichocladiopsis TaxID=1682393 RepID=A0A9P8Y0K2_9PEZI|nr:uncharacterized protein B0I36DRAFT_352172 [Microdochium trichocladiopsis]KAH7026286.1 hypothetical protein B0I36DRAFT_352172 [Microdochium trichocladiopsis]